MSGYRTSVLLAATFALLLMSFQNCASDLHQPTYLTESSYDGFCGEGEECDGGVDESSDQLFLRAQGDQYITVEKSTTGPTYLELGGDCYVAGFKDNEVHYKITEMVDMNGEIVRSVFHEGVSGRCSSGRFTTVFRLPSDYKYNLAYSLELELVAYDSRNRAVTGPSGRHQLELVPPR